MSARDRRAEVGIAFATAIAIILLVQGLAAAGLIAILVLVACGVSLVLERRAAHRRRAPGLYRADNDRTDRSPRRPRRRT